MDTTMSIYAHVIEEADQKSALPILIASLIQKQGTEILKNKSALNPLPKPCFEASYELNFQGTKKPEILDNKGFQAFNLVRPRRDSNSRPTA